MKLIWTWFIWDLSCQLNLVANGEVARKSGRWGRESERMAWSSRKLTANEKLKTNGEKKCRMLHSPFLCFLMLLNGQLFTHPNICTDLPPKADCFWKSYCFFSYCSTISKSPLTAIVTAFHWQTARLNLHFFVFWAKLNNLGFGTPKFEGIQREVSSDTC